MKIEKVYIVIETRRTDGQTTIASVHDTTKAATEAARRLRTESDEDEIYNRFHVTQEKVY